MAPVSWNGSKLIYTRVIRPFVLRKQGAIDRFADRVKDGAKELVDQAQQGGSQKYVMRFSVVSCFARAGL